MWRGRLLLLPSVLIATVTVTSCTSQGNSATPPAAVRKIYQSLVRDGLHSDGRLTLSWTHTTVARWARVTHAGYPPTVDLSTNMLVVEVDSDKVMTCDGCIVSWLGGHRPSGHFVMRTSRMGEAGGPETSIGPHATFQLTQLGPVRSTTDL